MIQHIRKFALAGALVAGLAMAATPAAARDRYHGRGDRTGTAIAAGVIGLAVGAALASGSRDRYYDGRYYDGYDGGYYDRGYYPQSYYPRYRTSVYYDAYPRYRTYYRGDRYRDYDRRYDRKHRKWHRRHGY